VAGGSNIFLHTGLLLETSTPDMLLGVLAHETGHIAGGHLLRGAEQLRAARIGTILSYIGGIAAVASGAGDAGMAVMTAGAQTSQRGILAYTRSNEESADQAALGFLDSNHLSANGMLQMFEILQRKERQHYATIDPYTLTHPLSKERINNIRSHMEFSSYKNNLLQEPFITMHARMLGKLEGFLQSPDSVLTRYPTSDKSIRAHYARAVAYYRKPDIDAALAEMDALQKTAPKDAYYYDMRGQILFEHGKIKEAQDAYRKAFQYAPSNPLIQTSLAQTLMAQKNTSPAQFTEAVSLLQKSAQNDASNALSWRLLAEAQGNLGNKGGMHLAQAELAALQNDLKSAESFSMQALQELPSRSPAWYRAQDLSLLITREKENKNDAQSHDLH
jgi:predicted Zn-dependent protease